MPFLDIAISQPCSCFCNTILAFRSETHFHKKYVTGNDRELGLASVFSWKNICVKEKLNKNCNLGRVAVWRSGGLMIKAVATLEITSVTHKNEGVNGYPKALRIGIENVRQKPPAFEQQSWSEDSVEVGEREQLRRKRISKANKGNTPWNKGRKHTPETLQKIKERTRLAMQDPKVRMKLVNFGHAQNEETRMKIAIGVRLGWERRRERLMLQETCHYEWQNLIAVAARNGLLGEEESQWDAYEVLNEQLEKEWLQSVEQKSKTSRQKDNRRAPKSAEQKRKIAAAIAAKWTDSGYRDRVCSGQAKFHGTSERVERKPRRKPSGDGQPKKSLKKKDEADNLAKHDTKSHSKEIKLKRIKAPIYKDPLAGSKLEMLKNIRAQRTAPTNKKTGAVARAKLMIAKAEKAAESLEIAARNNPFANASLLESRTLIAEAIQFIESIEKEDPTSFENDDLSEISTELPHVKEEINADSLNLDAANHTKVNGFHSLTASNFEEDKDFSFNEFVLSDFVKGNASDSCYNGLLNTKEEFQLTEFSSFHFPKLNNTLKGSNIEINSSNPKPNPNGSTEKSPVNGLKFLSVNAEEPIKNIVKKWVRGRLVEVEEE